VVVILFSNENSNNYSTGYQLTANQIVEQIANKVGTVVLAGAEPTLEIDHELLLVLKESGYKINLESNGSKPLKMMKGLLDHVTMIPRQSSGLTMLESCDDLKILYPFLSEEITPQGFKDFKFTNGYIQPRKDDHWFQEHLQKSASMVLTELNGWKLSVNAGYSLGIPDIDTH
jgi:organic radical activating enzyme